MLAAETFTLIATAAPSLTVFRIMQLASIVFHVPRAHLDVRQRFRTLSYNRDHEEISSRLPCGRDGVNVITYDHGRLYTYYTNDMKHGLSVFMDIDHQLRKLYNYRFGALHGVSMEWHESGMPHKQCIYSNLYSSRTSRMIHRSQRSPIYCNYKIGVSREWYKSGQLRSETRRTGDYRCDELRQWSPSGVLEREIVCHNCTCYEKMNAKFLGQKFGVS